VIDEMKLDKAPAVAILPLGTGNDLGRTMGWGGGYNNESMEIFIKKVIYGKEVQLDRFEELLPCSMISITVKSLALCY
jgi:diacylglycerol kinase (ATP)